MVSAVNFRILPSQHTQRFREHNHQRNDQSGPQGFRYITSCKLLGVHLKYIQVQTHVQTASESPDLNMDFHSFDNVLKQLYQ